MDRSRSETFFADLVRRFHQRVYRVAYRIVGSESDAADVTQQVFLRVMEKNSEGARLREPEAYLTWLASRLALNHLRGERRRQRREEEYAMSTKVDYEDRRIENDEAARVLRRELYRLPEPQRMSVVLCCQEGLTLASVAQLLSCAESTIHARIKDGLARLKAGMERQGFVVSAAALPELMSGSQVVPVPSGLEDRLLCIGVGRSHRLLALPRFKTWVLPLAAAAVACVSSISFWNSGDSPGTVPSIDVQESLSMDMDSSVGARMAIQPSPEYGRRVPVMMPAEPPAGELVPSPKEKSVKVAICVVDGADKAVANVGVEVLAEFHSVATALTDKAGKATLEIPEGSRVQWILALKSGVGFDYYENYKANRLTLTPTSELTSNIKLVLDGAKTIRIHAEDERGVSLAQIGFVPWLFSKPKSMGYINLTGSKLAVTKTDGKGDAVFDWIPPLLLDKGDPPTGFCLLTDAYTWPDQDRRVLYSRVDSSIRARLRSNLQVSGRVKDPKGQGTAGVLVVAEGRGLPGEDYFRAATRSGTGGRFSLLLAPGQQYTLSVVDSTWAARVQHLELKAEALPQSIQFDLVRGTLICGTVLSKSESTPIAGLRINLLAKNPFLPVRKQTGKTVTSEVYAACGLVIDTLTDKHGQFAFRVADGDYYLAASGLTKGSWHMPLEIHVSGQLESKHELFHGKQIMDLVAPVQVLSDSTKNYEFWLLEAKPKVKDAMVQCGQCHVRQRQGD